MKLARYIVILFTVMSLSLSIGCDGSDGGPLSPDGSTGNANVTKLRIEGPLWVLQGSTATLRAIATFADGSTRDVSNEAEWSWVDPAADTDIDNGVIDSQSGATTSDVRIRYGGMTYQEPFFVYRRYTGGPVINFDGRNTIGIIEMSTAGETKQLRVTCRMSDQRVIDVTDKCEWTSSNPNAISVDQNGLATAHVAQAAAELSVTWRERRGSNMIQVGEPLPDEYRIVVSGIRLHAEYSCDSATNLDGGDGEFVFEINVIKSDGSTYPVQVTADYPSRSNWVEIDQNDILNLTGEAEFYIMEYQSFQVQLRMTEWDKEFTDFGDPVPDSDMNNEVEATTHYNDAFFDAGSHSLRITGASGDCQVRLDYSISVERL